MNKVTIDDVKKGIVKKINTFRDKTTTEIYSEEIPQNFKEPCFFIKEIRSSQNRELGNRYKRGHFYDIHYFPNPKSSRKNQELRDIAEILYDQMEYIEVAGKLTMGQDMNHEIIDGVLHFFVKYPIYLYKETESIPSMGSLDYKGGVKND